MVFYVFHLIICKQRAIKKDSGAAQEKVPVFPCCARNGAVSSPLRIRRRPPGNAGGLSDRGGREFSGMFTFDYAKRVP